ncbi:MAG: DUF1489 domain-containing protein [Rhodospirillaceae bacterium]|nr:DUF1489 domain-containing protein [Rhodospirillaceae bacterium]
MPLHIIKLAVGVEDVDHLIQLQKQRLARDGALVHVTRNTPKREDEVLDGGSIYWVIRRFIRVRQRLIGFERGVNDEGRPACTLMLGPVLVATELKEHRAFQGWRYMDKADAPPDLSQSAQENSATSGMPGAMADELRLLGLL